eukprot:TRINITY_DN4989_c0_g2_i13.p1 TRINITY_DN4989_c0_g2~~TRINITY_DN4989_c0_g2_i13.p1  ORF type:complete len:584 (+),score=81.54 TRINITY_DN4989_c0_g2_i13:41-1753(+)
MSETTGGDIALLQHTLRAWEHGCRSMECPGCGKLSPSPQTDFSECTVCRYCGKCCSEKTECQAGWGQTPHNNTVHWTHAGDSITVHPTTPIGSVSVQINSSPPIQSWRLVYTLKDNAPRINIGNRCAIHVATIFLPTDHSEISRILRKLVMLLNTNGVSHKIPLSVDDNFNKLPMYYGTLTNEEILSCVMSPRGDFTFTYHRDGSARMMTTRGQGSLLWTRRKPRKVELPVVPSQLIDLSPCLGKVVLAGAPCLIVSASNGALLTELREAGEEGYYLQTVCVTFSPCGRYVAVLNERCIVTVHSVSGGDVVSRTDLMLLSKVETAPLYISFSSSGGVLSTVYPEHIAIITSWRLSKSALQSIKVNGAPVSVEFDPNDAFLLTGCSDGGLLLHSTVDGVLICGVRHPVLTEKKLVKATFHDNGSKAVSMLSDGSLWVWAVSKKRMVLLTKTDPHRRYPGPYLNFDLAPRGRVLQAISGGFICVNSLPYAAHTPILMDTSSVYLARAVHQQAGQRSLLLFLQWQLNLNSHALPVGVTVLKSLDRSLLLNISQFVPDPCYGDVQEEGTMCSVM